MDETPITEPECFGCHCTLHQCAPGPDGNCDEWHASCADAANRSESLIFRALEVRGDLARRWRRSDDCTHAVGKCPNCVRIEPTETMISEPRVGREGPGGGGSTS
jgi:hypothetical protein